MVTYVFPILLCLPLLAVMFGSVVLVRATRRSQRYVRVMAGLISGLMVLITIVASVQLAVILWKWSN